MRPYEKRDRVSLKRGFSPEHVDLHELNGKDPIARPLAVLFHHDDDDYENVCYAFTDQDLCVCLPGRRLFKEFT